MIALSVSCLVFWIMLWVASREIEDLKKRITQLELRIMANESRKSLEDNLEFVETKTPWGDPIL